MLSTAESFDIVTYDVLAEGFTNVKNVKTYGLRNFDEIEAERERISRLKPLEYFDESYENEEWEIWENIRFFTTQLTLILSNKGIVYKFYPRIPYEITKFRVRVLNHPVIKVYLLDPNLLPDSDHGHLVSAVSQKHFYLDVRFLGIAYLDLIHLGKENGQKN